MMLTNLGNTMTKTIILEQPLEEFRDLKWWLVMLTRSSFRSRPRRKKRPMPTAKAFTNRVIQRPTTLLVNRYSSPMPARNQGIRSSSNSKHRRMISITIGMPRVQISRTISWTRSKTRRRERKQNNMTPLVLRFRRATSIIVRVSNLYKSLMRSSRVAALALWANNLTRKCSLLSCRRTLGHTSNSTHNQRIKTCITILQMIIIMLDIRVDWMIKANRARTINQLRLRVGEQPVS